MKFFISVRKKERKIIILTISIFKKRKKNKLTTNAKRN